MFAEDVSELFTSPGTNYPFELREHAKQLSENKGKISHLVVSYVIIYYE